MMGETTPFTPDDRIWAREKETRALRDAMLSDEELDSYRLATEREVVAQQARGSADWWQELTVIRLEVIAREVAYRRKVASLGEPGYAPGDWWERCIEQLRDHARHDLVAIMVEGGLVIDERRGREDDVWGRCPIHHERTASFHVDRELGTWWCFGCQAGGDVFTWLEKAHDLHFREAVRWLAQRYGVDLTPPPTPIRYRTVDT